MSVLVDTEEKLYTVPEFLDIDFPDDRDYELVAGHIFRGPDYISGRHGALRAQMGTELDIFAGPKAGEKRLGTVFMRSASILDKPDGYNFLTPDISFVLHDHFQLSPKDYGPIPVAPDLVVEIWSPSTTEETQYEKIEAYQAAGVPLIWSIHMLAKYIVVHKLNQPLQVVSLDGELTGEPVLPGFRLAVKTLFE